MSVLYLIVGAVCLAVVWGAILSFASHNKIAALTKLVSQLKKQVNEQQTQIGLLRQLHKQNVASVDSANVDISSPIEDTSPSITESSAKLTSSAESNIQTAGLSDANKQDTVSSETPYNRKAADNIPEQSNAKQASPSFDFETFLMGNGLLWIGAIVLALGGVFLAKYSVEAGLFPPSLRLILGGLFGCALVAAAEYLYQHPKRFQINSPVICAALASGGLITCFAIVFVAFSFYQYLPASLAFVVLAIISLASTSLTLRYGPLLAAVGLIGGYLVPALVSTGGNNVLALFIYTSLISVSAVWIHQTVKHKWIWWVGLLGHFVWFAAGLWILASKSLALSFFIYLGYATAAIYLFILWPVLNWQLTASMHGALTIKQLLLPRKEQLGIVLPVLGCIFYIGISGINNEVVWGMIALSAILMTAPLRHSAFDTWPFIALACWLFIYTQMPTNYDYTENSFPFTSGFLVAQVSAFVFMAYSLFMQARLPSRPSFSLLLVVAPLLIMGLSYALSNVAASQFLYPLYSLELVITAAIMSYLAIKAASPIHKVALLLLANGAVSLSFTMLLSASVLSLAIVIQIALMTFISRKYSLQLPTWLYKIAMSAVLIRLSIAPWLSDYADETIFGLNWALVIYPLSFGIIWWAKKFQTNIELQSWYTGSLLHLVALFITTQTSYLLVGAYPDLFNLSYKESVLLAMNWLLLSGVYFWKARASSLPKMQGFIAVALTLGFCWIHADISLLGNPFITSQTLGTMPIINWTVMQWLVPSLLLMVFSRQFYVNKEMQRLSHLASAVMAMLFINVNIRLAFNDTVTLSNAPISQAELYAYSIVWLIIAVAIVALANHFRKQTMVRLGFGILAVVLLKAFLVDMANLEGLLRAASFIGLGLSLVLLGWVFQRFSHNEAPA